MVCGDRSQWDVHQKQEAAGLESTFGSLGKSWRVGGFEHPSEATQVRPHELTDHRPHRPPVVVAVMSSAMVRSAQRCRALSESRYTNSAPRFSVRPSTRWILTLYVPPVRRKSRGSVEDASMLLHELIHHRQAPHHWYCPAAPELPAYRLQEA